MTSRTFVSGRNRGFACGSNEDLVHATERIVTEAGGDLRRLIMGHERRLGKVYPSHAGEDGLRVTEAALASDEPSRISARAARSPESLRASEAELTTVTG